MKPQSLIASLLVLACTGVAPAIAGGSAFSPSLRGVDRMVISVAPLSADEADTLLWMQEEEKMGRDVYLNLYQRWNKPVFKRIATSEQRHFNAISAKIELFGLADTALPDRGQFNNTDLQAMYDQLVAEGALSYVHALAVAPPSRTWISATCRPPLTPRTMRP